MKHILKYNYSMKLTNHSGIDSYYAIKDIESTLKSIEESQHFTVLEKGPVTINGKSYDGLEVHVSSSFAGKFAIWPACYHYGQQLTDSARAKMIDKYHYLLGDAEKTLVDLKKEAKKDYIAGVKAKISDSEQELEKIKAYLAKILD